MTDRCFVRRAALAALVAVVWIAGGACRPDAHDLFEESLGHLERAAAILEQNHGDEAAATAALDAYIEEQRDELLRLRREGGDRLAQLPPEERAALGAEAKARTEQVLTRIMNAARGYPNPSALLVRIRKLQ